MRSLHGLEEAALLIRDFDSCPLDDALLFLRNRSMLLRTKEVIANLVQETKDKAAATEQA